MKNKESDAIFDETLLKKWKENSKKERMFGKEISKEKAYEGLGDPTTWEADAKKVYEDFRRKPPVRDQLKEDVLNTEISEIDNNIYYDGGSKINPIGDFENLEEDLIFNEGVILNQNPNLDIYCDGPHPEELRNKSFKEAKERIFSENKELLKKLAD